MRIYRCGIDKERDMRKGRYGIRVAVWMFLGLAPVVGVAQTRGAANTVCVVPKENNAE